MAIYKSKQECQKVIQEVVNTLLNNQLNELFDDDARAKNLKKQAMQAKIRSDEYDLQKTKQAASKM